MRIAKRPQIGEKLTRGDIVTALALHRLNKYSGDLIWWTIASEQCFKGLLCILKRYATKRIRKRQAKNFTREWAETLLKWDHSGTQRHAHIRAPVITIGKGDQRRPFRLVTRHLYCVFNGFPPCRKEH